MPLSPLLNAVNARFGIDGAAISTHRGSAYLKGKFQQAERHFNKFNVIPTNFKQQYSPLSKIVFGNPTQTGLNILAENSRLFGKHSISFLEPYCLLQFNSRLEAEAFKRKITAYLQRSRSFSTVLFDSDLAVGKLIPKHCFPGETLYVNSKSKKRTDVIYVAEDKLEPGKWVCKFEVRLKSATEVKRLTGIGSLGKLADLVGNRQEMKQLMERLLGNVSEAKVDLAKLARFLGKDSYVTGFLRMVSQAAFESPNGDLPPPSQLPLDSFAVFKQGIRRLQDKLKSRPGRKSASTLTLLKLNPSKFKLSATGIRSESLPDAVILGAEGEDVDCLPVSPVTSGLPIHNRVLS
jgi:hypothetical protein